MLSLCAKSRSPTCVNPHNELLSERARVKFERAALTQKRDFVEFFSRRETVLH